MRESTICVLGPLLVYLTENREFPGAHMALLYSESERLQEPICIAEAPPGIYVPFTKKCNTIRSLSSVAPYRRK